MLSVLLDRGQSLSTNSKLLSTKAAGVSWKALSYGLVFPLRFFGGRGQIEPRALHMLGKHSITELHS
jgi:hypothetical protein